MLVNSENYLNPEIYEDPLSFNPSLGAVRLVIYIYISLIFSAPIFLVHILWHILFFSRKKES